MVESRDVGAVRTDFAGLVTFTASLFLIVFGLLRGNAEGWGSSLITSTLVGGAALLVFFVVVEARQARPMLDLSLFRRPAFVGVSVATFAISAGMFALFPYLSIYLQDILGASPLGAGLRFLPLTASSSSSHSRLGESCSGWRRGCSRPSGCYSSRLPYC